MRTWEPGQRWGQEWASRACSYGGASLRNRGRMVKNPPGTPLSTFIRSSPDQKPHSDPHKSVRTHEPMDLPRLCYKLCIFFPQQQEKTKKMGDSNKGDEAKQCWGMLQTSRRAIITSSSSRFISGILLPFRPNIIQSVFISGINLRTLSTQKSVFIEDSARS